MHYAADLDGLTLELSPARRAGPPVGYASGGGLWVESTVAELIRANTAAGERPAPVSVGAGERGRCRLTRRSVAGAL